MGSLNWYLTRASGLAAWAVLAISIIAGLLLATRLAGRTFRKATLRSTHKWLSIAGLALVGVHLLTLVADNFVHFGAADLTVPFASAWRTIPVAFGVVAMWSLVAVGVSTALRPQLRPTTWRSIHLLSYLSYGAATIHLLGAGTDASAAFVRIPVAVITVAMAALSAMAALGVDARRRQRAAIAGARGAPAQR